MSRGTTKRAVRVEDALWLPALTLAKERGDNLAAALVYNEFATATRAAKFAAK